jgi:hypothetical protein
MQVTNILPVQTDIACDSVGGLSSIRNIPFITSGGSITALGSEILLSTNTTNGAVSSLRTAERARHTPGCDIYAQIGVRMPTPPTGSQMALWGLYSGGEGFGFGQDATGFFVFMKTGNVLAKTYKTNWNIDKLDGTGPSALNLPNLSGGLIFQFRATWYGGIEYSVFRPEGGIEIANVHRFKLNEPMYLTPYLPLTAEVQNNTTTSANLQLAVSIRKITQIASGQPSVRPVSHNRLNVSCASATDVPLISVVKKTGVTVPVNMDSVEIITDQPLLLSVIQGGDLSVPTYVDPNGVPTGESVCNADVSTTQNPTNAHYQFLVPAGYTVHKFDPSLVALVDNFPLSLYANAFGGTGATVSANLRWHEQW